MNTVVVVILAVMAVATLAYGLYGIWSMTHHGRKIEEMMKREFPSRSDD